MTCVELLRTQAFIDGELDSAASRDAEHHLESCAVCQAFVADAAMAGDLLRQHAQRYQASASLRRRVIADMKPAPKLGRWTGFWLGAGSGGGLVAAALLFALLPPSAASLSDALVDAHADAVAGGRDIQVVSTDHHTVKPWLAAHAAISPPVTNFARQGFTLVGGRTEKIDGRQMAVMVYRHGAHEIDVYVWPDGTAPLPAPALRHGYHLLSWKSGDLCYAAISDMEKTEMEEFVRLVRSAPE